MNEKDNILCRGIWYGDISNNISKDELWHKINNENDERKKLLIIIDLLKLGDFSAKQLLIKIMNESNDDSVINLCLRVFCSIAEGASVDEIGEFYINKKDKIDVEKYYYKEELAFPGILTKKLLDASVLSRKDGKELKEITIPTMLSIWSGIECPVQYYTVVDDDIMIKVFDYVKQLSKMNWEKGCKYFYGHKI